MNPSVTRRLASIKDKPFIHTPQALVCGALVLRLLLMVFTGHNDALFIPWLSFPILQGHLDIYEFLGSLQSAFPGKLGSMIWASNPPFTYFTIAGWLFLLRSIGLFDPSGWSYASQYSAWQLSDIPRALFFYKLLFLGLDLACWAMLRSMVPEAKKRIVDLVWLLSPLTLLGVYVMGQTEMFPIFFTVLSLYFARKVLSDGVGSSRYSWLAMLCLGIGSGYKVWPLLLIPAWAIYLGRSLSKRILLVVVGVIPFLLSILPFLSSSIFRKWVLGGFATGFLNGSGGVLPVFSWFIFAWGILHIIILFYVRNYSFRNLWASGLTILAVYFCMVSGWEFYWLAWLLPFFTLAVAEKPALSGLLMGASIYFIIYAMIFWNLGIELFLPTGSTIYALSTTPHLRALLFGTDTASVTKFLSVGFSLFAAILAGMIALLWIPARSEDDGRADMVSSTWATVVPTLLFFGSLIGASAISFYSRPDLVRPALAGLWDTVSTDPVFFSILLILVLALIFLPFTRRRVAVDS